MRRGRVLHFAGKGPLSRRIDLAGSEAPACIRQLPLLPETLLAIQLAKNAHCIDLNEVSALFLRDPGAVARIFYAMGAEVTAEPGRISRLEDCICELGMDGCLAALDSRPKGYFVNESDVAEAWMHCSLISELCGQIAASAYPAISASDAIMVGLFHEMDKFPALLGWESDPTYDDAPAILALDLAREWRLPYAVAQYFRERATLDETEVWTTLVDRAHACLD